MTAPSIDTVVEELRALRLYEGGVNRTTVHRAADALEAMGRELAEARAGYALVAKHNAEIEAEHEETFDKLASAERQRDAAMEALTRFARLADSYFYRYETQPGVFRESHEDAPDEQAVYGIDGVKITAGDLRRARTALTPREEA